VAVPVQQPAPVESVEYRKQLAEDYGFRQIGELLPNDVTLKDVINSLPKEVPYYCYYYYCVIIIII